MTPGLEPIEAERCLKKFQPAFEVYATQPHGTLSYSGWKCCYALEASACLCKHLVRKHRDAEIQAVAVQSTYQVYLAPKIIVQARKRKWDSLTSGEVLFGLSLTQHPELERIEREIRILDRLYS